MKKLMKSLMLFAAAAMALTSCENEAMNEGIEANDTYTMTFVAGAPESKTSVYVDGNNATFSWSEEGEQVAFVQWKGETANKVASNSYAKDGDKATFGATFNAIDGEGNYNYIAVYPNSNYATDNLATDFANDKLRVEIPDAQTLTANTFDPAADLMVSLPISAEEAITEPQLLQFHRLAAIGRMNLKGVNDGENIEKVVFTIGDASTKLVGRHTIKFTDGTINEASYYGTNTITLTTPLNGEFPATKTGTPIYFTCLEGNYSGAYSVEVTTNLATYSTDANKEISAEKPLAFTAGNVLGFNLTVSNRVDRDLSIDYSGEYVIVAKRSTGNFFYMTPDLGTASTKRFQAVDTGVSTPASVTTNADYVWTVAKNGTTYTLAAPNGQFASWTSGNSAALSNDAYALNIEQVEGEEYYKISSASTTERIIALNTSNNYFAFYEGSGIQALYLVPNIVETKTLQSIAVSGQTTEYTVGDTFNFDGTVTATYTGDTTGNTYIAVIAEGYTVSEPNMTQAAENVEVTVTYEGKTANYTITVKEVSSDIPADETFDLTTDNTKTATAAEISWLSDFVEIKATKGNTNANNYYGGDANNRTSTRFYTNSNLTITPQSGATITSVVFEATSTSYASALKNSTWTGASASVSSTTVTVTPSNGANAFSAKIGATCGFKTITVNYVSSAEPEPEPEITLEEGEGEGTEASPYDVTRALEAIEKGHPSISEAYVQGTISQIDQISTQYGNATYYISVDGTTTNHLKVFRGLYLDGADFTSEDQLHVGDVVVIKGELMDYEGTKEFNQGSQIVSLECGHAAAITISVENQNIANTAAEGTVTVTVTNGEGYTFEARETADVDWLEVEWQNDGVYYIAGENTGAERTATVEIFATDGENEKTVSFTITQAAGNQSGEDETYTLSYSDVPTSNSYSTTASSVTATDSSTWEILGYLKQSTYQYIQFGSKSSNYILTPVCTNDISTIELTCTGSYTVALWTVDGTLITGMYKKPAATGTGANETLLFTLPAGHKQVKIISTRTTNGSSITGSNAATYISKIVVNAN